MPEEPKKALNRKRVRPQVDWRIPALMIGMGLFFFLGLGTGYLVWGKETAAVENTNLTADAAEPVAETAADPKQVTRYDVSADDDPSFGPADAPITIIEFSDYQCPYCQKWHAQVWTKIAATYPDQVRLVYRDFPLYSIHPQAEPAANAANCANEQGKYWEYHSLLFTGGVGEGNDAFETYATNLGLDMDSFRQCVTENRYEAEITADYEYAVGIGIQSTPTFFINGIALIGAQPYEVFQEVIEMELAGN